MTNEQKIVESLIADCKGIVEYHLKGKRLPLNGKQIIRRTLYCRLERLTFAGFGDRVPIIITGENRVS